jgi:cytochrome c6
LRVLTRNPVFFNPKSNHVRLPTVRYFLTLQAHIGPDHSGTQGAITSLGGRVSTLFTRSGDQSMKSIFRTLTVVLAVAFACSTWAFADAGADYKAKCATCHGAEGKGDTPAGKGMKVKDLASDDVQKQSDADLATIINKGKKPMPGYEGKLTKEQVDGLVKYIRSLKK